MVKSCWSLGKLMKLYKKTLKKKKSQKSVHIQQIKNKTKQKTNNNKKYKLF